MALVSKVSATIYADFLSKVHFFFDEASAKKKFPKRNAVSFACAAGAAARRATAFEKAVQNNRVVGANNVRDKSKFENKILSQPIEKELKI